MITVTVVLDIRKVNKDSVYPIKLRVTSNRIQNYLPTGYKLNKEDFEKSKKSNPPGKLKDIKIQLDSLELKAKKIINEMPLYSFQLLKERFYTKSSNQIVSLKSLYESVIEEKINKGKISTASNYNCAIESLKKYNAKIDFHYITPLFLTNFENDLLNNGKSRTTISMYLRTLKTIFNLAITKGILPKEVYPFGKGKYIVPQAANPKRALTKSELKKIFEYKPSTNNLLLERAKDFFILSYLCNGMNINDLLKLKKTDYTTDFITYRRSKTKETYSTPISVPILPEISEIINKWRCNNPKNDLLFNFLTSKEPKIIYSQTHQFIKLTNKYLRKICTDLAIEKKISSYYARHSFSKSMLDSGQNIAYISNSLGHSKISTTQAYLNSFDDYDKHGIAKSALLNF